MEGHTRPESGKSTDPPAIHAPYPQRKRGPASGPSGQGMLRQLGTPDERCPGKSAESYPLWGWISNWHQREVPFASPLERIHFLKTVISGCPSPLGALRC